MNRLDKRHANDCWRKSRRLIINKVIITWLKHQPFTVIFSSRKSGFNFHSALLLDANLILFIFLYGIQVFINQFAIHLLIECY